MADTNDEILRLEAEVRRLTEENNALREDKANEETLHKAVEDTYAKENEKHAEQTVQMMNFMQSVRAAIEKSRKGQPVVIGNMQDEAGDWHQVVAFPAKGRPKAAN